MSRSKVLRSKLVLPLLDTPNQTEDAEVQTAKDGPLQTGHRRPLSRPFTIATPHMATRTQPTSPDATAAPDNAGGIMNDRSGSKLGRRDFMM